MVVGRHFEIDGSMCSPSKERIQANGAQEDMALPFIGIQARVLV